MEKLQQLLGNFFETETLSARFFVIVESVTVKTSVMDSTACCDKRSWETFISELSDGEHWHPVV